MVARRNVQRSREVVPASVKKNVNIVATRMTGASKGMGKILKGRLV